MVEWLVVGGWWLVVAEGLNLFAVPARGIVRRPAISGIRFRAELFTGPLTGAYRFVWNETRCEWVGKLICLSQPGIAPNLFTSY